MEFKELKIAGLYEIIPRIFKDDRGYFFESYSEKAFKENGIDVCFVQDNQSFSIPNVIRGLHFQNAPHAQGKLVRALKGKVLDVAVDLREGSPTFGKYDSVLLEAEKGNMIYVPEGFAHGFAALEESQVLYKCTRLYHKDSEGGIRWDDPSLAIEWGVKDPIVSEKDKALCYLKDLYKVSSL